MSSATEEVSRVFLEHYEAFRLSIQRAINSGAMPRFAEQEWINDASNEKLSAPSIKLDVIYYKDNNSAFESACDWMDCSMHDGKIIPALIEKVATTNDGLQMCQLKLPGENGGARVLFCKTINSRIAQLQVGDLVAYLIANTNPELKRSSVFGCIGFVVAKLEPAISNSRSWKVARMPAPPLHST